MAVLQFTIPVPHDKTIITQRDVLPHFYPHLHRHKEIQLTWVQKGEGTFIIENKLFAFRSNEIYWIGANQAHMFKSDPSYFNPNNEKSISSFTIFFNPHSKLTALFDLPEMKSIRSFLARHRLGFRLPPEQVPIVAGKMLTIWNTSGVEQLMHFTEMLQRISSIEDLEVFSPSGPFSHSESEGLRISSVYDYILRHYNRSITLEDVARQAHMTPHAFCRYFKKHTRHTFLSFLNEVRINEACRRLTTGRAVSISNVAHNCGFNSVPNFNRVFKEIMKKSPSRYLSEYRGK